MLRRATGSDWVRAALLLAWSCASLFVATATLAAPAVEFFTRAGCPHCRDAARFLASLKREHPELQVVTRHVDADPQALQELETLSRNANVASPGVPAFRIGDSLVVGFLDESTTGKRVRMLLWPGETPASRDSPQAAACAAGQDGCPPATAADDAVSTWLFGQLRVSELGLPLFTVLIGLIDGLNPCAMWVLLFLLSMLVNLRSRARMAIIAGTFVAVSGLMYFAFMAAWLNVFLLVGVSRAVQLCLGAVALGIGAINVKDYFAFGRGPSLSIPDAAKPRIYAGFGAIVRAENLTGAMSGIVLLAVLVNVVELLCTAGLPAVYTAILTRQDLQPAAYYGYLGLYNLAYVFDDSLMVGIAVVTLGRRKLQERAGRWLKLVSGVVMIVLAIALLFFPDLLI